MVRVMVLRGEGIRNITYIVIVQNTLNVNLTYLINAHISTLSTKIDCCQEDVLGWSRITDLAKVNVSGKGKS